VALSMSELGFHGSAITVEGFADLEKTLHALAGEKLARKMTRKAISQATKPMMMAMKRGVPNATGPHTVKGKGKVYKRLRRSIGRKFKYYKRSKTTVGVVGPRLGKWMGYHAHLVEYGTAPRYRNPKEAGTSKVAAKLAKRLGVRGGYTGVMPPHPFIRPAFIQHRYEALSMIRRNLAEAINQVARRKVA